MAPPLPQAAAILEMMMIIVLMMMLITVIPFEMGMTIMSALCLKAGVVLSIVLKHRIYLSITYVFLAGHTRPYFYDVLLSYSLDNSTVSRGRRLRTSCRPCF